MPQLERKFINIFVFNVYIHWVSEHRDEDLEFLHRDRFVELDSNNTRKFSSRMRTTNLETVHALVSVATTRCHSGGGLQMNKFQQI